MKIYKLQWHALLLLVSLYLTSCNKTDSNESQNPLLYKKAQSLDTGEKLATMKLLEGIYKRAFDLDNIPLWEFRGVTYYLIPGSRQPQINTIALANVFISLSKDEVKKKIDSAVNSLEYQVTEPEGRVLSFSISSYELDYTPASFSSGVVTVIPTVIRIETIDRPPK